MGFLARQVTPEVFSGQLIETDNYMRLVRVNRLAETRDWYDSSIPRSNAPFGEVLHWTRPLDVIILGASLPFLPFFEPNEAIHLGGVFVPPVLFLLTCYAAAWASVPLVGGRYAFYAMITLLAQPGVVSYGLLGRPDHHLLLVLLFTLSLGSAIRWVLSAARPKLGLTTGAFLGFGLWVGPEFLLTLALVATVGTFAWVREGREAAIKNLWLFGGFLSVLVPAWLLEHPPSAIWVGEYDRISVPHVLVGLVAAAFWIIAVGAHYRTSALRTPGKRLLFGGVGVAFAAIILALAYPPLFRGPTVDIDPRIWPLWLDLIEERSSWMPPSGLADIGDLISYMGGVAFSLPFVGWVLFRDRRPRHRGLWFLMAVMLGAYTTLALFRVRHVPYVEILIVLVTLKILSRLQRAIDSRYHPPIRAFARAGGAALLITGPLFLGLAVNLASGQTAGDRRNEARVTMARCPISTVTGFLASKENLGRRPLTIGAHLDYGPEILYRTPHRVLGTPYHRNSEGILAGFRLLAGTDLESVEELVRTRGVGLVIICPLHSWIYRSQEEHPPDSQSLHDRLLAGKGPDWLKRVSVPEEIAGEIRVFEVIPDTESEGYVSEGNDSEVSNTPPTLFP